MAKAIPLPPHTAPLSAAVLCTATNIEAEARSTATRGLPVATETELTKSEAALTEIVKGRIDQRHAELDAAAHAIRAHLGELPDARSDGSATALDVAVSRGLGEVFQTYGDMIRKVVEDERTARAEFNAYRERHSLHERRAQYPVSKIRHFALVLLLLLVEAGANTIMYLPATSGGYLGAFLTAMIVAVINIGVATFAGYIPARYLSYHDLPPEQPNRQRNTRLWAIPALVVSVLAIIGINMFAAHYRELAITTDGTFKETEVLQHLLSKPFDLSLASYGLLAAGLLCAMFAGYKAFSASDRYPGYEQAHRQYIEKAEDREDTKRTLHGSIEAVRLTNVDGLFNRATATRASLEDIRRHHSALKVSAAAAARLDDADLRAANDGLLRFRRLNQQLRTDGNVPAYFKAPPNLDALKPQTALEDLPESIEAATTAHIEHTEGLLKLIAKNHTRIDKAKEVLERVMPPLPTQGAHDTGADDTPAVKVPTLEELTTKLDLVVDDNKKENGRGEIDVAA